MKHSGPGIRPGNRRATYNCPDASYENIETLKRENRRLRKEIQQLKDELKTPEAELTTIKQVVREVKGE